MKIAIFSDTYFPQVNGVAQTLKRLTNHFEKHEISYQIYSPVTNESSTYPTINQFPSLPLFLYPECRTVIVSPRKIENNLQKFKPDLIHLATPYMMGLYGLFAAKKLNIPVVSSYHTHFDQYLKYYRAAWLTPLLWKYLKWFHHSTERIFVPSKETLEKLQSQGFDSLKIWGRGIDCQQFKPIKNARDYIKNKYHIKEKYILLYVGRLAPEKDLKTLSAIIEKMPVKINQNIHWLMAGDGPNMKEWKEKSIAQKNITMTGYIRGEELARIYAGADLFVYPSYTETFGNVVLESLACGTPAIVADEGGVAEIVEDNKTGIICKKENADDFIHAINYFLINDEERLKMGMEARTYALTKSWDFILDCLLVDYREIIASNVIINKKFA
ncbi:glycosyltransferase family 4 protein [Niallia sp. 03133]|uniref:glycosyltransferase family 4 protein n=1 Tax=Niallia sp. 03133 TaxID=3458060 RepID=UPI00404426EB